jgi:hypothetical protein
LRYKEFFKILTAGKTAKEQKMKKIIFVLIPVACLFFNVSATLYYPVPVFEENYIFVIDTFYADGNIKDYVRLHNDCSDSNMNFKIYVHDPDIRRWELYGTSVLKGRGDRDIVKDANVRINRYRYFAIEPLNKKEYKYSFYKERDDLNIRVQDKE